MARQPEYEYKYEQVLVPVKPDGVLSPQFQNKPVPDDSKLGMRLFYVVLGLPALALATTLTMLTVGTIDNQMMTATTEIRN